MKLLIVIVSLVAVLTQTPPADPCTAYQNPPDLSTCLGVSTVYPNALCCFLKSTKNGVTNTACFPSYPGAYRTYSENGISAIFTCSTSKATLSYLFLSIIALLYLVL